MSDADLRIMDDDHGAVFALNLPHYSDQLVAGTSHILRNQGVLVTMPDYDRVPAQKGRAPAPPQAPAKRQ